METEEVEPWRVRCLIIIGGLFGLHRLYLSQIPEAFVFFSTLGVFLIGWLYDSFMFKYEVEAYNEAIFENSHEYRQKFKKGKMQSAQSKHVRFSFTRLVYSVLYGCYIGTATWLACTVTFGWTHIDTMPFIAVLAVGVTAGVYIIGQCGEQSRELTYIWLSAFATMLATVRLGQMTVFRAIFVTALVATVIGNRSAKAKKRRHSWKHFVFWCSLFLMLVCVILLGCSRKVADKQVSTTRPGQSRETNSVGSLIRDRLFEPRKVHRFFAGDPLIEYHSKSDQTSRGGSEKKKNKGKTKEESFWQQVWSGELFDELTGAAHLTKIDWIELTTTFVVDVLRAEARVLDGSSHVEPFKWALWRNYLIHRFSMDALVSDDRLRAECRKWKTSEKEERKKKSQKTSEGVDDDYSVLALRTACNTFSV